jgi:prevent-host-death family protein
MKTATVRELRNNYTKLLAAVKCGEEVVITQRGVRVARLVPDKPAESNKVDWSQAPEVLRDRSAETVLTEDQSAFILRESSGQW